MPVVEILYFSASDAFIKDNSLGDVATAWLKKADGVLSARRGFQLEEPTKAFIIINWQSFDKYTALTQGKDFKDFLAILKSILEGPIVEEFSEFNNDSNAAFNAPVTELATVTTKEGENPARILELAASLTKELSMVPVLYPPPVYGEIKDTPGSFLMAAGWESAEAHKTTVSGPPFNVILGKLSEIADIEIKHAAFTRA